jgi:hypothetical protein
MAVRAHQHPQLDCAKLMNKARELWRGPAPSAPERQKRGALIGLVHSRSLYLATIVLQESTTIRGRSGLNVAMNLIVLR